MSSKRNVAAAANREPVVLLVEDEDLLRPLLRRILSAEGLRVIAVPSALHALQVLEEQSVDVVVSDMKMQGPNGLRLLETVRDCWPHVGRIILTAYVTPELRRSPAVDLVLDKSEDAAFVVDSIAHEARRRNGNRG